MTRSSIPRGAFAALLFLLLAVAGFWLLKPEAPPSEERLPPRPAAPAAPEPKAAPGTQPGFLYGRITTVDGATFEGRLRWGVDQEAFWSDYLNGAKPENPWAAQVPPERLPKVVSPVRVFGVDFIRRVKPMDLGRLFMARFGDLARIESRGREVRVTLKSGTSFPLARMEASDFDDGVQVWDGRQGAVYLDSVRIRTIEFLPVPRLGPAPARLYGTVRAKEGDFTGFLQWDREEGSGTDEINGRTAKGEEIDLRFDAIRSIARASADSARVSLRDGREIVLSGKPDVGKGNRGVYVDDPRYGRVLVPWDAFVRADFTAPDALGEGASGPAYGDFPPGRPLHGSVTTRAGRRLAGRLVYDLDESETTETLDAPSRGVDYTLPFALVASIALAGPGEPAKVTLRSGEELQLDREGDLGENNAGLLVFAAGGAKPEYVRWNEVARVDFDAAPSPAPPAGAAPSPTPPPS